MTRKMRRKKEKEETGKKCEWMRERKGIKW